MVLGETQNKDNIRLTVEQRLGALERDTVVLHDTVRLLHRLLKEQGQLISDYIVRAIAEANGLNMGGKSVKKRPEEQLYTFVCRKRFDSIDRRINTILKLIEDLKAEPESKKRRAKRPVSTYSSTAKS